MDSARYIFNGKLWKPSATTTDCNSFFHAAFGTRNNSDEQYFDKQTLFRRMQWATFLTYYQKESKPHHLEDLLRKCLLSKEKYKTASIEDEGCLQSYTEDIMKAEEDVTLNEIPIMATMENTEVAVVTHGCPDATIVVKPDPRILGKYPLASKPIQYVVLLRQGNTFLRLEAMENITAGMIEAEKSPASFRNWGNYKKRGGSAGSKGVEYQVNLLTVVLLNALGSLGQWRLSTENESADKFDDIVLEDPDGAVLIQAKHKDGKKKRVTLEDLLSTNKDDYSLPKYFLSYVTIKKMFKVKNVIICTNVDVHEDASSFLNSQPLNPESMLYHKSNKSSIHTLKDEIFSDLKEKTIIYYHQNFKNKDIDEAVITEENLRDFQKDLQLYFNYPIGNSMGTITENLSVHTKSSRASTSEIYNKVKAWFQQKHGLYLNENNLKGMLAEILTEKYLQKLSQHNVSFENLGINYKNSKMITHVVAKGGYLLPTLKTYQTLQHFNTKILCFDSEAGIELMKLCVEGFKTPHYKALLIIWRNEAEGPVNDVLDKLRGILRDYPDKEILVVAGYDNKLLEQIDCAQSRQVIEEVTLRDVSNDTRETILKKKIVLFQGKYVSLQELFTRQIRYEDVRSELLETLARGETVRVGLEVQTLNELIYPYYINRTLYRCIKGKPGDDINSRRMKETVTEDKIYDVNEKVIMIADDAGAGKSTVLAHMAGEIKNKYPHLWVITIELNAYTTVLKQYKEKNRNIEVTELINFMDRAKLPNDLEKIVFSIPGKVVLFVDGVDEISPDYTDLIVNILKQCGAARNIAKLFVSTRPFMSQRLEHHLRVASFKLEPLNERNQIHFLKHYWINNLKLDGNNESKCEHYAKMLIMLTSSWIRLDNNKDHHLAAIPLQVMMLAEVFQENSGLEGSSAWQGCKEYLNGNDPTPKFPKKMNVSRIYEMFIQKKRRIFHDKGNPSGNTSANVALDAQFQECLACHEILALKVILGDTGYKLFSSYQQDPNMEVVILKIGVVQKSDNRFYFIHRTFGEYFVAKRLLSELKLQTNKPSQEFQKFFFDKLLLEPKFKVIRIFLDSFLLECVDSLPSNIFQIYMSLSYDINFKDSSNLIHQLSGEGCVTILQLLFKCISYEVTNDQEIDMKDLFYNSFPKCVNILQVLQFLVQKNGVNIEDESGFTPLYLAVQNDHLEMVKFLISRGANVNTSSLFGKTALSHAVECKYFEIVKFLVQQGADTKLKQENDCSLIYKAVCTNHVEMVKYLLEQAFENGENLILLYVYAYMGRLEELRKLLDERFDINSAVENDETLIFGAARGGQLDVIKYLIVRGADINNQDGEGNTALHLVAWMPTRFLTAKLLVELGIDVNVKNFSGNTALFCGIRNLELVELLVKSGAKMNIANDQGTTALSYATSIGQLDVVKYLVSQGCDLNIKDNRGKTLLHSSSENGALDVLKFLLDTGMDINERDDFNNTLIHSALNFFQDLDIIRFLVKTGVDINIKNSRGNTALHIAVMLGKYDLAEYICQSGADINLTNNDGYTALHLATSRNQLDIVQLLIGLEAEENLKDKKGHTALQLSALCGHWNVYNYLLKREEILENKSSHDFNKSTLCSYLYNQTFLHFAAAKDQLNTISFFLNLGVDINITDDFGCTLLHFACGEGQLDTVKFLVQHGLDFNIKNTEGRTALYVAAQRFSLNYDHLKGSRDIVEYLFRLGADISIRDNYGCTLLHSAASVCHSELVKLLIKWGVDIHLKDCKGNNALHHATNRDYFPIITLLLEHGLDVNTKNDDGYTALHLAAMQGSLNNVKLLRRHGSDITTTDNIGRTVLHSAVTLNDSFGFQKNVINYLLDSGINVDARDNNGSSALHLAVLQGNFNTVQYLVRNHGSINIQDNDGRTALHLAASRGNLNMIKYIVSLCDDINVRDYKGNTVLHFVALENSPTKFKDFQEQKNWRKIFRNVAKFLIEQGADVHSTNFDGNTAADLAEKKDNFHLFKCLKPSNFEAH